MTIWIYSRLFLANLALTFGVVAHLIGYFIVGATVTPEVYRGMPPASKVLYIPIYFWVLFFELKTDSIKNVVDTVVISYCTNYDFFWISL